MQQRAQVLSSKWTLRVDYIDHLTGRRGHWLADHEQSMTIGRADGNVISLFDPSNALPWSLFLVGFSGQHHVHCLHFQDDMEGEIYQWISGQFVQTMSFAQIRSHGAAHRDEAGTWHFPLRVGDVARLRLGGRVDVQISFAPLSDQQTT